MNFFPRIYEDELLYSAIARYHVKSGNIKYSHTIEDIMEIKNVKNLSIYFPNKINRLISNLPLGSNYNAETIIKEHTLYRLYTAFLTRDSANLVFDKMLSDEANGIATTLGICSNSISMPEYFRFCPLCSKNDLDKYGEMYWHRIHQIPCILVCSKHKILLQNSNVKLKSSEGIKYIAPNKTNCNLEKVYLELPENIIDRSYSLAKKSEYILNNNLNYHECSWFVNNYKNYLVEMGLATYNGQVRQKRVMEEFEKYFGTSFLETIGISISNKESRNSWLSDITRNRKNNIHPIKHLLFIDFLGIKILNLFELSYEYNPFGEGPWPCLNIVCNNYKKYVIKDVDIKFDNGKNKILGIFSCDCGFKYTRNSHDKNKYHLSKKIEFGEQWELEFIKLVQQKKFTLTQLAEKLDVAWNTIDLYAEKFKLDTYWRKDGSCKRYESKKIEKQLDYDKIFKYRQKWLEIIENNGNISRTELRKINITIYTWLYKNDKNWLCKNLPEVKVKRNFCKIIDWNKRDNEILEKIKIYIENILNSNGKPVRITKSQIIKNTNLSKNTFQKLDRIPKTKAYLDTILEDEEQFIRRKVKWAIATLKEENIQINKSKIKITVNVNKKYNILLNKIIIEALQGKLN